MDYTESPVLRLTAAGRYQELEATRSPFLERARDCSRLTIPSLVPPAGHSAAANLPQPWQSFGAMLVKNLAAKIMLALFPPGAAFFRLGPDTEQLVQLVEKAPEVKEKLEEQFSLYERAVMNEMEQNGSRGVLTEGVLHLIVAGNMMLQVLEKGIKLFTLDSYVVRRDVEGRPYEILVKEKYTRSTLPQEVRDLLRSKQTGKYTEEGSLTKEQEEVDVYTWMKLEGQVWKVRQECEEIIIPSSHGTYRIDACPWIPLRWTSVPGEDYGRGQVEEHLGDLNSTEVLQKAIVTGTAIAAKVVILLNPGGVTEARDIAQALSGDVKEGRKEDVSVFQVEKQADFAVAQATLTELKRLLSAAFLYGSALRRDAERVTAEEIRIVASELEQQLGGVYSVLAFELQLPLVSRLLFQLQKKGALPKLPKDIVRPKIITGLEALGRNSDLQKLDLLISNISQAFGPEEVKAYVNLGAYAKRKATALQIDIKGIIRTDEEIQAQRDTQMKHELAMQAVPAQIQASGRQQQAGATPQQAA